MSVLDQIQPSGSNYVPTACKSCRFRYNDWEEGQNCTKVDRKVRLADGRILEWPGYEVGEAYKECKGELASHSFWARLMYIVRL